MCCQDFNKYIYTYIIYLNVCVNIFIYILYYVTIKDCLLVMTSDAISMK